MSYEFDNLQRLSTGEWRLAGKSEIVEPERAPADVQKPADVRKPVDVEETSAARLVGPIPLEELLEVQPRSARRAA